MNLRTRTNLTSKAGWGVSSGSLLAGVAIAIVPPAFRRCVFHSITGYSCMTCG